MKHLSLIPLAAAALLAGCPSDTPEPVTDDAGAYSASPAPRHAAAGKPTAETADKPQLTQTDFAVKGMTCESCSAAIEQTLIGLPGVTTVSADWEHGVTRAQYDAGTVSPEQIVAAIDKLGYTASLAEPADAAPAG